MTQSNASLRAILTAACLGFLVVELDVSVVNVGFGALKATFNTDLTGLQWVINSYALPFSALLILGGAWGDKWGAKSVFAAGFYQTISSTTPPSTLNEAPVVADACVEQT